MNYRRLVWCLAFVQLVAGATLRAETGVVPYNVIVSILDGFDSLKEKDRLILSVRVVPAKQEPATPIQLEIRSRGGAIPLRLTETGEFVDFPITAELRAENPPVASNQPKGTLSLQGAISLKFSGKLEEEAAWYLEALRQANAALKAQAGLHAPKLKTLVVAFEPGASDWVMLKGPSGERRVAANAMGQARFEPGRETKGARLLFSSAPKTITAE